jgi:hypothetical protein
MNSVIWMTSTKDKCQANTVNGSGPPCKSSAHRDTKGPFCKTHRRCRDPSCKDDATIHINGIPYCHLHYDHVMLQLKQVVHDKSMVCFPSYFVFVNSNSHFCVIDPTKTRIEPQDRS